MPEKRKRRIVNIAVIPYELGYRTGKLKLKVAPFDPSLF
jgi:hypothetical protein